MINIVQLSAIMFNTRLEPQPASRTSGLGSPYTTVRSFILSLAPISQRPGLCNMPRGPKPRASRFKAPRGKYGTFWCYLASGALGSILVVWLDVGNEGSKP